MSQFTSRYVIDKHFHIELIVGNHPDYQEMFKISKKMEENLPKRQISNGCVWNIAFDDLNGCFALQFNSPNMVKWLYKSNNYYFILQLFNDFTKEGVSCDFDNFFERAAEIKQEMDHMRSK